MLYLLNHVAQTSAASSLRPTSEVDGADGVSNAQFDPVMDVAVEKGEGKASCRFACGKSWTSSCKGCLPSAELLSSVDVY